jgi:hypothetical protein
MSEEKEKMANTFNPFWDATIQSEGGEVIKINFQSLLGCNTMTSHSVIM